MPDRECEVLLRVRYSETDQMGTFYNSRVLEWFECGRTEYLRQIGVPYVGMEAQGVFLPLIESYVKYLGRARYNDLLRVRVTAEQSGKARLRFALRIEQADDARPVAEGYTVHAIADASGQPMRPPCWLVEALGASKNGVAHE